MNTFFRRTSVKIVSSIICIVSLSIAIISGLFVLLMLSSGVYDAGGNLYKELSQNMMSADASSIMYNYFDPYDPTHPWQSYYDGGIYTGEQSNFLYTITDAETGKTVLTTYDGQDVLYSLDFTHSFEDTVTETTEDLYTVTNPVFQCDGQYFLYNNRADCFEPLDSQIGDAFGDTEEVDSEIYDAGFSYNGTHYSYDYDTSFYADEDWDSTSVSWVSHDYTITCYLLKGLPYSDMYGNLYYLTSMITSLRYWLIAIFAATLILGIVLLAKLGCSVGRVNGKEEPVISPLYRIPPDIALCLCAFFIAVCLTSTVGFYESTYIAAMLVFNAFMILGIVAAIVYAVVTICVHVKTHTLINKSLIYWCIKNIGRLFHLLGRCTRKALNYLPLLWKVLACYAALCLIELIALICLLNWIPGSFVFLWIVEKLVLGALVGYVTLCFRRLKTGAEHIAAGDYNIKVSQKYLVLDFKDTANTLNHIQDGMTAAVDSRIKSERFKTELITNVSHDLKTPLTSIVSYVDLLKQEPAGSEAAKEYLTVLDRQSMRLKKLIEDLVEASKASTGNLNLQLEPLDFNMLLGQALGEYSQRLTSANLTPVLKIPEIPVMVNADGRRLWRVFDNLLGNAVKYAMPGTRLYLTVDVGDTVTATFRNVSQDPLDVSAEDLMERFVRGDASRHTEGSGLGLSIARSLTESMGGHFAISIDGDLFKAMVTFPVLPSTPEEPTD